MHFVHVSPNVCMLCLEVDYSMETDQTKGYTVCTKPSRDIVTKKQKRGLYFCQSIITYFIYFLLK